MWRHYTSPRGGVTAARTGAAPAVKAALVEFGRRGGLLDARDELAAGPAEMKAAEVFEQGARLGSVGSRIVAEAFVGLMR